MSTKNEKLAEGEAGTKVPVPSSFFAVYLVRLAIFFLVALVGIAADLGTKNWVFQQLGMPGMYPDSPDGVYWVLSDFVGFQTSLNQGALFGMGQGQVVWLAILSVIFLLGIVGLMIHSAWKSRLLSVTLGLIVAGICGNLYDRLGLHDLHWHNGESVYAVRDWILVMIGSYPWPNFNIADSMLVTGACLLVLHTFFVKDDKIIPAPSVSVRDGDV